MDDEEIRIALPWLVYLAALKSEFETQKSRGAKAPALVNERTILNGSQSLNQVSANGADSRFRDHREIRARRIRRANR